MSTLYRKYRPQNFKELVGQNHIKITISHEVEVDKIAHAYLFCGPRAVGKTTLARVFAKAINCQNRKEGEHEPCDKCESCQEISEARSVDIIEIDAASHTGVDNVRENIIDASRVRPTKSKYKVFIIDEVHMLSISAFNALLKVMEEPPEHVVFILCTTEIHKVPSTVISRCQRFDFRKISYEDITGKLKLIAQKEKVDVDPEVLQAVARKSEGHMRDAESIFGQIISLSGSKKISRENAELIVPNNVYEEAVDLLKLLSAKDAAKSIALLNKTVDNGINLNNFLDDLVEILRKLMFVKINPTLSSKVSFDLGVSLEGEISKLAAKFELPFLIKAIELFSEAKQKIKNSFIVQLPVEVAIIKLCSNEKASEYQPAKQASASGVEEKPATPYEKNTESGQTEDGVLTIEELSSRWTEVLTQIKKLNHSLVMVMQASRPKQMAGSKLLLATKYKFHKDRLDDINIKGLVEKVLYNIFKKKVEVEAVVDENMQTDFSATQNNSKNQETPNPDFSEKSDEASKNETEPKDKNDPSKKDDSNNMMDNMLKTFGGRVVNS